MLSDTQKHELDDVLARGFTDIALLIRSGESSRAASLADLLGSIASVKNKADFDWIMVRQKAEAYQNLFPEGGPGHTDYKQRLTRISQLP